MAFFGIRPNMTVVEGTGAYYAAAMDPTSSDREDKQYNAELKALFDAHPALYKDVKWSVLAPGNPKQKPKDGQAYVGEDYAIGLIESVGFKLVGRSSINNNPKDTKDYPKGVWSLPPTFAEGAKNRAKYAAIGESDRFTLKFVKPG